MSYYPELGSGQVEYTVGRVLVHFGSPSGTNYGMGEDSRKNRKISVKDWMENNA